MPVYNEAECIVGVVASWRDVLSGEQIDFRMFVLNDGSTDGTAEAMEAFAADARIVVVNKPNAGHGPTILQGYRLAVEGAEWVFQCDSDDEMKAEHFGELWRRRQEHDALFGCRAGRQQGRGRRLISACSRLTVKALFGGGVRDVNTPYRLIRAPLLREIVEQIPPDTFAPNVIVSGALSRAGVRIANVPVPHEPRRTGAVSIVKWKLWKAAFRSLWQTLWCRPTLAAAPARRGAWRGDPERVSAARWSPAALKHTMLALVLLLVYAAAPLSIGGQIESDAVAMSAAVRQRAMGGEFATALDYRYSSQPGTYMCVGLIHGLLQVEPLTAFRIATILAGVSFVGFSIAFVASVAAVPAAAAGLVLLLFQESYIATYFENSTIIAAGFLMPALVLASRRTLGSAAAAGGLFALAALARLDAALMGPALLVVLLARGGRRSLVRGGLGVAAGLVVLVVLIVVLGVSVSAALRNYSSHGRQIATEPAPAMRRLAILSYLSVFTGVVCLLAAVGLWRLAAGRNWRTAMLCALGIVPMIAAYRMAVTTPKYMLYAVPFLAMLCAHGVSLLRASSGRAARWVSWAAAGLFALQYVASPLTAAGPVAGLPSAVVTHDGIRRIDGIVWAPMAWLRVKRWVPPKESISQRSLRQYLQSEAEPVVLTTTWGTRTFVLYELSRLGWRVVESRQLFDWSRLATDYNDAFVFERAGRRVRVSHLTGLCPVRDEAAWRNWLDVHPPTAVLVMGKPRAARELLGRYVGSEVELPYGLDDAWMLYPREDGTTQPVATQPEGP